MKSPEVFVNMKKSSSPSMVDGNLAVIINTPDRGTQRHERVVRAVRKVECELDERLRSHELIGQVIDRKTVDRVRVKARRVTFTWQRGIKIGEVLTTYYMQKLFVVIFNQLGHNICALCARYFYFYKKV